MSKVFDYAADAEIAQLLKGGAVGVIPTDTVYGLVCLASNKEAVDRLYKLKERENKPGTIVAANIEQLEDLGLKHRYVKAVEQFWPNPLSIVIPCGSDLQYLHRGLQGLAVRIPKDVKLSKLLKETGALLTTSANLAGQPVAHTIHEAQSYFGEKVDFYVDGGDMSGAKESTVIRIVDDAVEILRDGAVKIDENGRVSQ